MKVSAIMPARGRRAYTAQAIGCFLSQDYADKELLILDDEDDPATPSCLSVPGVKIFRQGGKMNIGEKRNWLCEKATGEIIVHFDSDDWSAPDRMSQHLSLLAERQVAVVGYHSILFYDVPSDRVVKYRGWIKNYAVGTSLAYRRDWWMNNHFPEDRKIGEDTQFATDARMQKQIFAVDGEKWIVARNHKENTCPRDLNGCSFQPLSLNDLPKGFIECRRAN